MRRYGFFPFAEEYRIGALTIRDASGAALSAIPSGTFLVSIPVAKLEEGGNSLVFLAAYTESGQYRGLLYVGVNELAPGAGIEITLPIDNAKGDIAVLKAFPVSSFDDPVPIGTPSCFPAQ